LRKKDVETACTVIKSTLEVIGGPEVVVVGAMWCGWCDVVKFWFYMSVVVNQKILIYHPYNIFTSPP
jgi:hypothetical protein